MKTLVLGLDGASPERIEQWIDQLPAFKLLKEHGIFGRTVPPVPAQTPVAWTTFMTGKNPGKHGIFSFALRQIGTYERKIISPRDIKAKTLWSILNNSGKRVGMINVPMSDCLEINGFVIPGFLSSTEGIAYPLRLKKKIEEKFGISRLAGDLEIETLEKATTDPEHFFEQVEHMTNQMAEICFYLLQEENWDFFMPVFMGLDRIHHFFWKYIDPSHPEFRENSLSNRIKTFYVNIDRIVDRFLKSVGDDTLVIVLSDHGFCPIRKEVFINNYLEENGFLETRSGRIYLENSRAVSYGYGDIWLNVKGREPKGLIDPKKYNSIRNEIATKLKRIEVDGEKPVKDVKNREDLWWGPRINEAPDMNVIFQKGYQAARRPEILEKNEIKRYVNDGPRWSGGHDGTHDPLDVPGIIGVYGPDVGSTEEIRVHLWDVAPTILDWMGVSILSDMDGKSFLKQLRKE